MDRRGSKAGERRDADTASASSDDLIALAAARSAFARWLRERREARGQTIEDVARVTRIQQRALERLEGGRFDELPADVFVRGFIRNYARCVGIDADDALARYGDCGVAPAPRSVSSLEAQALLDQIAALAPVTAARATSAGSSESSARLLPRVRASGVLPVVEPEPEPALIVEPEAAPIAAPAPIVEAKGRRRKLAEGTAAPGTHAPVGSKASRKRRNRKNKRAAIAAAAPAPTPAPIVIADAEDDLEVEIEIIATPPPAPTPAPVRASRRIPVVAAPAVSLTIDDDDPDAAERAREAREPKEPSRRSFLPPILLDEERSGRQGGLTLAVIILLIVATLTLSYLMRRPNSSGEGVSARDVPARVYA